MTARRPKSQEALISRRSRKELRRVLPRERERTRHARVTQGSRGGHGRTHRDVEGKELTRKRGGLRRALGESGGHRRNQESTQGATRGHGESRLELGGGA